MEDVPGARPFPPRPGDGGRVKVLYRVIVVGPLVSRISERDPSGTMSPSALRTFNCRTASASARNAAVGLDVHLPGPAESVEVVHVVAAEVSLQGVEHIIQRHPHRLGLLAVDVEIELGRLGAEAVEDADEAGLAVGPGRQAVRPGLERVEVHVPGGLHHHPEPARIAQAADRRRGEDEDLGLRDLSPEAVPESGEDRLGGMLRRPTLLERLEDHEHVRVIRAVGVLDERRPRDGDRMGDAGRFHHDLLDRGDYLDRASSEAASGSWTFTTR